MKLAAGTDSLTIAGGAAADTLTAGSTGVNLNNDSDRDVTWSGLEQLSISGGDAADTLSAAGGLGTGSVYPTRVSLAGGAGNDKLTGG